MPMPDRVPGQTGTYLATLDAERRQRRAGRRAELCPPTGRLLRHVRRLRVDGLRPDGTFDGLIAARVFRAFGVLPRDVGL
jgi:hypothetical protein